jgi:hypothetical protein
VCLVVADGAEGEVVARVLGRRDGEAVVEGHDEGLLEKVKVRVRVRVGVGVGVRVRVRVGVRVRVRVRVGVRVRVRVRPARDG